MRFYISGPKKGLSELNVHAFNKMETILLSNGHSVFNEAQLNFDDTWSRKDILAIELVALSKCDAIYMLNGWESSMGAKAELAVAESSGLVIFYESDEDCKFEDKSKDVR